MERSEFGEEARSEKSYCFFNSHFEYAGYAVKNETSILILSFRIRDSSTTLLIQIFYFITIFLFHISKL